MYCLNNAVSFYDPSGFRVELFDPTISVYGGYVPNISFGYSNPKCTIVSVITTIAGSIFASLFSGTDTKSQSDAYVTEKGLTEDQDLPTVIYRYGKGNPGNLTPREKDQYSGLSFSTVPRANAVMTTIEEVNATGILYAEKDGPTHVSVKPVNGTMANWISAGPESIWTKTLQSICVKWDGDN